ncbi:MAG TPA: glycosyltransferase family A protein [Mucilaginibacter sp.]|nr:glycosyltransferase family A protein [Mucilaginibacter sp.]
MTSEKMPLVSIIIPVYNAEKYLAASVRSAIAQTWPNKEIIVIDDGSTDNSLEIAKSFESDTVNVIGQENKGASVARNQGLERASGSYIQFLDADDMLSPDKIALQVELLNNNPGKVAVCSTVHFKDDSELIKQKPSEYEENFLIDLEPSEFLINLWGGNDNRGSMVQPNAWLTPADIVAKAGKWNESLTVDDDGEFFCRVLLSSKGIVKSGGFNYYRKFGQMRNNLSAQRDKMAMESLIKALNLKKEYLFKKNRSEQAERAMYRQFLDMAVKSYLVHPEVYRQAKKELKNYPNCHMTPVLGGKFINKIARLFGWETARWLQLYFKYF